MTYIWKKEENTKKTVSKFERKISISVRRQVKLDILEKRYFRRNQLSEKYMEKMLYEQDEKKFKEEYLKKLEKNQQK